MEVGANNRDCRTGKKIDQGGGIGGSGISQEDVQPAIDAECMSNCEGVVSYDGDGVTSRSYIRGEKANPAAAAPKSVFKSKAKAVNPSSPGAPFFK
jgi:hypothetical protein